MTVYTSQDLMDLCIAARAADKVRFWLKVDVGGRDDCWPWKASVNHGGYGQFFLRGRKVRSHRFAYLSVRGRVMGLHLHIDHLCRSRACMNPLHMEPVSQRTNTLRGYSPAARQARRTHCPSGHPLSGDNLATHHGHRRCKMCDRMRSARG